jgi:hypothetical protein
MARAGTGWIVKVIWSGESLFTEKYAPQVHIFETRKGALGFVAGWTDQFEAVVTPSNHENRPKD